MNRTDGRDVWPLMDEIVAMHNELYHLGQSCPTEDEDGECATRTGKPVVLTWTDSGPRYAADHER